MAKWSLWQATPAALTILLAVDIAACAGTFLTVRWSAAPSAEDWALAMLLCVAMTVHLRLARWAEASRRDVAPGPHIDLTSAWTAAAVIALPLPLALLVIAVQRMLLLRIRRRTPYRFVYSTAVIASSAQLAGLILALAGTTVLTAFAAVAAYGLTQALLVALAFRIDAGAAWSQAWGSREGNELESASLLAALFIGLFVRDQVGLASGQIGAGQRLGIWLGVGLVVTIVGLALATINRRLDSRDQLQRYLTEQAVIDPKTGLWNAGGWRERAEAAIARAAFSGSPLALLWLDLDHFKQINDVWGHPAGDAVLRSVATVLRTTLRDGDIIGRDGGEEFVAVLPDVGWDLALERAEAIRTAVRGESIAATDNNGDPVIIENRTASIGVAVASPSPGCSVTEFLDALHLAADAAVYQAKRSGRDQVQRADVATVVDVAAVVEVGDVARRDRADVLDGRP